MTRLSRTISPPWTRATSSPVYKARHSSNSCHRKTAPGSGWPGRLAMSPSRLQQKAGRAGHQLPGPARPDPPVTGPGLHGAVPGQHHRDEFPARIQRHQQLYPRLPPLDWKIAQGLPPRSWSGMMLAGLAWPRIERRAPSWLRSLPRPFFVSKIESEPISATPANQGGASGTTAGSRWRLSTAGPSGYNPGLFLYIIKSD